MMIRYTQRARRRLDVLEARYTDAYLSGLQAQIERVATLPTSFGRRVPDRPDVYRSRHEHTWIFYRYADVGEIVILNFTDTRSEAAGLADD